jgi:hypothetical protein
MVVTEQRELKGGFGKIEAASRVWLLAFFRRDVIDRLNSLGLGGFLNRQPDLLEARQPDLLEADREIPGAGV